jgi:hypothetical protein
VKPGTRCPSGRLIPRGGPSALKLAAGVAWDQVDLDAAELYVGEQLQRVRHQLLRREVKTETSEAPLPLPDLCVTALKIRKTRQNADRDRAGDGWVDIGLVFTTRHGTR